MGLVVVTTIGLVVWLVLWALGVKAIDKYTLELKTAGPVPFLPSLMSNNNLGAIHEGTVAYAEPFTGYGDLVIVDHGEGAYSLYGYLSTIETARGQHVEARTRIGTSGRNPSGNPALYFELRIDGKPVDPLQWLKR